MPSEHTRNSRLSGMSLKTLNSVYVLVIRAIPYLARKALIFLLLLSASFSHAKSDPTITRNGGRFVVSSLSESKIDRLWEVMTNFKRHPKMTNDIVEVEILQRRGNIIKLRHTYQGDHTFGLRINAILDVTIEPNYSYKYRLVEGDFLVALEGSWKLEKVGGMVKITHTIYVKPKLPSLMLNEYYDRQKESLSSWVDLLKKASR